jgi:hypothetical protein
LRISGAICATDPRGLIQSHQPGPLAALLRHSDDCSAGYCLSKHSLRGKRRALQV